MILEHERRLADTVIDAISLCSVPRAIWHLSAEERWRCFRDTLLGHAPIRGGLRPRDLPIDGDFRGVLAAVGSLHYLVQPRDSDPIQQYRFGDWLYCFSTLIDLHPGCFEPDELPLPHQAIHACFIEMRRAFGLSESGEYSKDCDFLHRLIGAVGWSMKDWNLLQRTATKRMDDLVAMARIAARAAMISAADAADIRRLPPPQRSSAVSQLLKIGGSKRPLLDRLMIRNLRLMTIKTGHVQDYICRGRRHWLMRGASSWCAQTLAWARDEIPRHVPRAVLLSDSDVLLAFLMPADAGSDAEDVIAKLWRDWGALDRFLDRFPRLRESPAVTSTIGLDPRSCLPDLSLRISDPTTLLELCLAEKIIPGQDEQEAMGSVACRGYGDANPPASLEPCPNVTDDAVITTDPPPWLEVRGDNEGGAVGERFGFTSLVWSLCGTTLRMHWYQNVARICRDLMPGMWMMPVHHGEWLKDLNALEEPLTFLKLDGDRVGRVFRSSPVSRRPYLGMELGRVILDRVIAATRAVTLQRVALGSKTELPVDLVYLGGDDVFVCLPLSSVATFLAGFCQPLKSERAEEWRRLQFTYCSVTLPSAQELDPKSEAMQVANLLASHLCSTALQDVAKPHDLAALAPLDAKARAEGFRCDPWCPSLSPHRGSIDDQVMDGLHLRLTPLLPSPA